MQQEMTSKQYSKIQKLAKNSLNYTVDYDMAKNIHSSVNYYLKLQKACENNDSIVNLQFYDEETKNVKWYTVTVRHKYTREQWYLLLIAHQSTLFTYQQIKIFI